MRTISLHGEDAYHTVRILASFVVYHSVLIVVLAMQLAVGYLLTQAFVQRTGADLPRILKRLGIRTCVMEVLVRPDVLKFCVEPLAGHFGGATLDEEERVLQVFRPQLGDIVVDVGAHVGGYAIRAGARVGPNGTVIAIEPNPYSYPYLVRAIALNKFTHVMSENVVAWSMDTFLDFNATADGSGTAHVASVAAPAGRRNEHPKRIEALTLDSIIAFRGVRRVDWLKIDVEGAEMEVLEGARKSLAITANIIVEVVPANVESVTRTLREYGFRINDLGMYYEKVYYLLAHKEGRVEPIYTSRGPFPG